MFRRTRTVPFFQVFARLRHPSRIGYEITQLPDPRALRDFTESQRGRIVIAVLSESPTCAVTNHFLGSLHDVPLGSPSDVCLATMTHCARFPDFAAHFNVIAYPTCLVMLNGTVHERVLGARSRELSIKTRLLARREGLEVFSDV